MKPMYVLFVSLLAITALASTTNPPGQLVGRWQKRLPNGMMAGAIFRADSSFDGLINEKPFVSGKYYIRQDTFALADGSCGQNYFGMYKLTFVTGDSIHFAAIEDTCRGRRQGNDGLTMSRVKPGQPK